MANIDERLTSRFDAGLTVAIEPPELEMRVAILIKKAAQEGIDMPEDVAFFVAKNVRANVRELEGALRKVLAFAKFSHKEITINLAREALKDLLSIQNRQISVENIQKTVADFYKIKVADMYSKKRPASIARPRQIAMYLAKELTQRACPKSASCLAAATTPPCCTPCARSAASGARTPSSTSNCTCWSRRSKADPGPQPVRHPKNQRLRPLFFSPCQANKSWATFEQVRACPQGGRVFKSCCLWPPSRRTPGLHTLVPCPSA